MLNNVASIVAVIASMAMAMGPSLAGELTRRLPQVAAELTALGADGTMTAAPFFAAVAALGFAERAAYDVELVPQVPLPAETPQPARLLPFALLLDAALGKASAQTLDGIADAQGKQGSSAIYFEQGPVLLADIKAALVALALPVADADGAAELTLSRPLVLSSRATLVLLPGEHLTLDRAAGAFVIAAGGLIVDRATIAGSEAPNAYEANYRPFVLADAATGPVEISGARFERLGFGSDPRSAGLSITGGNPEPGRRSFVQDSSFDEMGSLFLVDAAQSTIRRNVFNQPFNTALAIISSSTIIVDGNAMLGSSRGHGVKLGPNAINILVSDNIVAGNSKHGLLLDGNTTGSLVFNNLLLNNQGSGIAVLNGSCLSLEQNATLANAGDGIMVRHSGQLSLDTNVIAVNRRAGISIVGDNGSIGVNDNQFDGNTVGLRASTSFDLSLSDNDWAGQTPRLLDGDIAQYTVSLLAGIKNGNTHLAMAGLPLPATRAAAFAACAPEAAT